MFKAIAFGVALLSQSLPVAAQQGKPLQDDASRADLFAVLRGYLGDQAPASQKELYAFPATFNFPNDAKWRNQAQTDPRLNQVFGIDLSHHNVDACHCMLDWSKIASQSVTFAYLKVSQGTDGYDKYYRVYRDGARSLPAASMVYVGPYHFLSSSGGGSAQAAYFLKLIDKNYSSDDLPPVMDLEWDVRIGPDHKLIKGANGRPKDFWDGQKSGDILRSAVAWLASVKATTGRTPAVYTSHAWWTERIGKDSADLDVKALIIEIQKYPFWYADYSNKGQDTEHPTAVADKDWILYQFTDNARFVGGGIGAARTVDANVFRGTPASFRSQMGIQ